MSSRKVSLSLPEELLKMVDEAANKNKMSRSEFITRILEKALSPGEKVSRYPTVLWKLQTSDILKLRSPKVPSRRIGRWMVEMGNAVRKIEFEGVEWACLEACLRTLTRFSHQKQSQII